MKLVEKLFKRIVSSIYIFYNSDTLIEVKKEMGLFKKKAVIVIIVLIVVQEGV